MNAHRTIPPLAMLLAVCATTTLAHAQGSKQTPDGSPAAIEAGDSAASAASDTVHKKHGGLFGKVKSVAKNKVVRQVAKVAACTMVPGGQVIAGAIDATSGTGAAGAAQGVAGAATGSSCMPGGAMGLAGGAGAMPGGGAGLAAGVATGMSPAQLAAMQAGGPGGMAGQAVVVAQMQQMMSAQMSAQMMSAQSGQAGGTMTEAPGQTVELSADPAAELTKGKTVVRNIDWTAGTADVSSAGKPGFTDAMGRLAAAMAQIGGSYGLDLYLDNQYEDAVAKTLGAQRLSAIEAAIAAASGGASQTPQIEAGKIKRDKHPRLEIIRRK